MATEPIVASDEDFDELASALSGDGGGLDIPDILGEDGEMTSLEPAAEPEPEPEPEPGKEPESEPEPEPEPKPDEPATPVKDEPAPTSETEELRRTIREQARQMALMQAKMDRIVKGQKPATVEDDDDLDTDLEPKEPVKEELSEIEEVQQQLNYIDAVRGPALSDMVELMELNPNFADVKDVCTKSRFDDVFEAAAKQKVEAEGGDPIVTQLQLESAVWQMPNPYKYMYGIIKKYHPDFAKPEDAKEDDKDKDDKPKITEPSPEAVERGKTAKAAPVSAVDVGEAAGGKAQTGWTAERIDALDESELGKVPEDVYEKYLAGQLDK